jgi:hypothetical protein
LIGKRIIQAEFSAVVISLTALLQRISMNLVLSASNRCLESPLISVMALGICLWSIHFEKFSRLKPREPQPGGRTADRREAQPLGRWSPNAATLLTHFGEAMNRGISGIYGALSKSEVV